MSKIHVKKLMAFLIIFVMMIAVVPNICIIANADYENTHTNTGNQRVDIVEIAKTQIGYHEGANNDTKYNRWLGALSGYPAGGYGYAWCQSFVSWCAAQANVSTSEIKRASGTVTVKQSFINNGTYHKGPYEGGSYIPKSGDIIYFYSSGTSSKHHVGIVSGCDGSTVYTIEGNSSDMVCERSYSVNYGNIRGYGCPRYIEPDLKPPTYSNLTVDKTMIAVGEEITFTASSDYATGFTIGIDNEKERYLTQGMENGSLTLTFNQTGNYGAYVTSYNSAGYVDSSWINFRVYDSSAINIGDSFYARIKNQSSSLYFTNTGSTINGQTASNSNNQIWKFERQADNSYKIISQYDGLPMDVLGAETVDGTDIRTWTDNGLSAQRYYIYNKFNSYYIRPVCSDKFVDMAIGTEDKNVATWGYGVDWEPQKFDITEVPKFISDNINRDFSICDFGDEKLVYISQTCSNLFMTADTGEFTGTHNVYGTEKNYQSSQIWKLKKQTDGSYRLLNMGNNQCMEVFGGAAANGTNISTYDETASFENQKFNFYYINGHYFISPVCTPCLVDMNPDGSHDVATYDYGDDWSSHQTFDITEVPEFIPGDINCDLSVSVADAVLLQKWLLGTSNATLENWKAGDLCKDNRIDVFDMIEMRKLLIQNK